MDAVMSVKKPVARRNPGVCSLVFLIAFWSFPSAETPGEIEEAANAAILHGKQVYEVNCAGCHGVEGRGDGPAASYLYPKPRDFRLGRFKIVSNADGKLPPDTDLFDVITRGMPGSAMPSWEFLRLNDRWAVVQYLKKFVRYYDEDEEEWVDLYKVRGQGSSMPIPAEPMTTAESIARGKLLYRTAECWKCHGDSGQGNGSSANTLKDEWQQPVRPRDFTAGIFKGGAEPTDLFRRITLGMPGTPMPGHSPLSDPERWDLVHFVRSLIRPGAQELNAQKRRTIPVHRIAGDLPKEPDDTGWKNTSATYVALMPLWWRENRIEGLLVRALHNGTDIAIQLAWEDILNDSRAIKTEQFGDGAAIQFALSDDVPFMAMGGVGGNVNIWYWKADREEPADVETEYPNMVSDISEHTVRGNGKVIGKTAYLPGVFPRESHAPLFLTGWKAGNFLSNPLRRTPVDDMNAKGFGTLTTQDQKQQNIQAKGVWDKGVWRTVFHRIMKSGHEQDAVFLPGNHVSVGFAVWDGSQRDRNGQKQITIWHDLEIQW